MHAVAHVRPSQCPMCLDMLRLVHTKLREQKTRTSVLTWCLVCGEPSTLQVAKSYPEAVAYFHALHEQPMVHASNHPHPEREGWGYHWRLDEVLKVAYPVEYAHDKHAPYWPYPGWYSHKESAEYQVQPVTPIIFRVMSPTAAAEDRMLLKSKINSYPRMRGELERAEGRIWDENQFRRGFTFMGSVGPFVIAIDRDTGEQGTMIFQEEPRFYWGFSTDRMI